MKLNKGERRALKFMMKREFGEDGCIDFSKIDRTRDENSFRSLSCHVTYIF